MSGDERSPAGRTTWTLRWVESTGSTNADLVEAATRRAPHGLVLVADHQTAGRGRMDRTWEAEHGANLLMSVLIRRVPEHVHHLTQAVAVAAAETCEAVAQGYGASVRVDLKWPNDVQIGGRKLAGILASAGSLPGKNTGSPDFVVVGLGLNIGWAPEGAIALAQEVAKSGVECSTPDLRDQVLEGVLERLAVLLDGADDVLFDRYRSRLATIGREVRVELPAGAVMEGRALGVEPDGRLVVLDACAVTHRLDVGDVVHLR